MKCLVIGGGIGGLCLAVGLRDVGIDVDLIEAKEVWTVYGVGIIQQGNVVRAMHQLGLLDKYLHVGFPFESIGLYDAEGNQKVNVPSPRLAGAEYPANIGVSRLALHRMLVEETTKRGTNIRVGVRVTSLSEHGEKVNVVFSDGTTHDYDLVVGADGAHSHTRAYVLGKPTSPRITGQGVWRHNFPRDPQIDHLAVYYGPNGNAGLVPLGPDLMYMFLTTTEPAGTRFAEENLPQEMRRRLSDFGGIVARLREQITDPKEVVYRPLETFFTDQWRRGRVLIIGDAAHTATPHLGQGAGMAIEDAVVLRDELSSGKPFDSAIEAFLERRIERCRYITELSAQVGDWEIDKSHYPERMAALRDIVEYTAKPI